jgi:hypothetical protein
MRRVLPLLLFAGIALPGIAAKRTTVQQLEQLMAASHAKPDADVAEKLSEVELSQRLSPARLQEMQQSLPGPKARGSLLILADAAAFLPLPEDEMPATPAPDPEAQHQMLDAAARYASEALAKMPNFFATRVTTLFMDVPPKPGAMTVPAQQVMQFAVRSSATVLYRNGKEVVETGAAKGKKPDGTGIGLITSGEFGPILGTVLADARQGQLAWNHWEQGEGRQAAVFRYAVPKDKSHYVGKFCCVSLGGGVGIFQLHAAYHGEIAIDPETGAILRMTMQADPKPAYPLARADLLVEYGPIEIGGKTYICPLKSVAIARGYGQPMPDAPQDMLGFGPESVEDAQTRGTETLQTMMNDVVFREYHLFRAETRILTEPGGQPDARPPASTPTGTTPSTPPAGPTR